MMMLQEMMYRFKILLNDKVMIFWTLIFPLILALFFQVALRDALATNMEAIPVAVVSTTAYEDDSMLQATIKALVDEEILFITYADEEKAQTLLKDKEVIAIMSKEQTIDLKFLNSGLSETIVKSIFDQYVQQYSMFERIMISHPELMTNEFISEALDFESFSEDMSKKENSDLSVAYFYTILAMVILYGAHWGIKSTHQMQADLSVVGMRICISPTHKVKVLINALVPVFAISMVNLGALFFFLKVILNIGFGPHLPILFISSALGILMSMAIGCCMGVAVKGAENKKVNLLTTGTLVSCFLAGMQMVQIRYYIKEFIPWFDYINPASLITDTFYITYYYEDISRIYVIMAILVFVAFLFGAIAYRKLRRLNYDSI